MPRIPVRPDLGDPNRFAGRETIYWDSLPDFFFLKPNLYLWVWPTSYNIIKYSIQIKRTTTGVVSIKIYKYLSSPIYKYKTVLLHLQIRARNLHVVNPYWCVGSAVCGRSSDVFSCTYTDKKPVLSFTLSGKHILYKITCIILNHKYHKTITDI